MTVFYYDEKGIVRGWTIGISKDGEAKTAQNFADKYQLKVWTLINGKTIHFSPKNKEQSHEKPRYSRL